MTVNASDIGARGSPSIWRNTAAWIKAADIAVVLLAISLPWSTSLVAIFAVVWLLLLIPTAELRDFTETLKRPACVLPVLLFALAVVGTLWATDIPWAARLQGINPVAKLLAIPILIRHFEKSGRGLWVGVGFLASCTVVMLASWLMFVDRRFVFDATRSLGVPVKNYIAQSQEFALCAFAAFGTAVYLLKTGRKPTAALLAILGVGFLANMVFVASSRTVFVCIPVLFVIFAVMHFSSRGVVLVMAAAIVLGAIGWISSPYLQMRTTMIFTEYQIYRDTNAITSVGERLEFWRKSIKFVEEAPLVGHGTGSTKTLFAQDAVGQTGASAQIIGNPHNQTLNVAVQWGIIGCLVLYAMWFLHLKMFTGSGLAAWIGLVAVVENFVSSLLNSHLFDFTEGWIYVLAVGIAGGMVARARPVSAVTEASPRITAPAVAPAGRA
ncbi:O-antigen ligase family protein [Bradyrhizobium sp. G127]|uniref:O-antigen ligase family protein n=1 Tax=Bradyrhizobium sp. G127 TaxID=2904800 RepID=UPI001F28ED77|nr:O-antigen ligase family protein [Bradyrhizobium sp. G127]MCF2524473.1 O-antigen ligase family protein [Bradyrhizobium sp. G127]